MSQRYELEKIIKSLNSKNSHGYDRISNKIIKASLPFIISPLTYIYICNEILKTGIFPDRLKYTKSNKFSKKVTSMRFPTIEQFRY